MDLNFNKNEDHNKLLLSELRRKLGEVKLGGGEKRIQKLHAEGKMTARERIDYLLDANEKNIEIGANSCVDRGKFSSTVLGDGCKIDN